MTEFVTSVLIPIGIVRCTKANRKKIVINTNSFNSNVTCCTNLGQESRVDAWAIDLNGENNIWLWNSVIWMDGDVWVRWHLQDKQRSKIGLFITFSFGSTLGCQINQLHCMQWKRKDMQHVPDKTTFVTGGIKTTVSKQQLN